MAIQPGTWNKLPGNCTRSFTITFLQCASWGVRNFKECLVGAWSWVEKCAEYGWTTVKNCSWWAFLGCLLWAIVAVFGCILLQLVFVFTCFILVVISWVFCLLWTFVSITFCLANRYGGTAFLLTDGTVMMQEWEISLFYEAQPTRRWWKLTPDRHGSYLNGSWSQLADSNLARGGFASSVLADGRVVVCGGEDTDASGSVTEDRNNSCEIYDPVANSWTKFDSPTLPGSTEVWSMIGDAPCTLLPDGSLLLGSLADKNVAKLDPTTLTWTAMSQRPVVGDSSEDSWALMPDNTVVTPSCRAHQTTWIYQIANDRWVRSNDLPTDIIGAGDEIGPGLLLYDGRAIFLGGNEHSAIYNPAAGAAPWSNGPDLPLSITGQPLGILDGPGALLVNGNLLFGAGVAQVDSAGNYSQPAWFFEFDGTGFFPTNSPPNSDCRTMDTRLLLLPDGDVMFCRQNDADFYAYRSPAVPGDRFRPVIQSCPTNIDPGTTIQVSGTQFNGLSQAVGYGDDSQTATNYPLVKLVNRANREVRFCRTHDHTTVDDSGATVISMGVATGSAVIVTNADVPADLALGDYQLFVIANGIASLPFDVAVGST